MLSILAVMYARAQWKWPGFDLLLRSKGWVGQYCSTFKVCLLKRTGLGAIMLQLKEGVCEFSGVVIVVAAKTQDKFLCLGVIHRITSRLTIWGSHKFLSSVEVETTTFSALGWHAPRHVQSWFKICMLFSRVESTPRFRTNICETYICSFYVRVCVWLWINDKYVINVSKGRLLKE